MPMIPFMERFPDLAAREMRAVTVRGRSDIPDGEYGFLELFCDERGCDCRRVMIDVLRADTPLSKIWATINYGWESVDFYKKWGDPYPSNANSKGPFLDPLNPQTPHSPALLNLFRLVLQSPDYVHRIQRHYHLFRQTVDEHLSSNA
jgi:hypothetical protein